MSVKRCHHCGTIMPRTFRVCPYCQKRQLTIRGVLLAVTVVALAALAYFAGGDGQRVDTQEGRAAAMGESSQGASRQQGSAPEAVRAEPSRGLKARSTGAQVEDVDTRNPERGTVRPQAGEKTNGVRAGRAVTASRNARREGRTPDSAGQKSELPAGSARKMPVSSTSDGTVTMDPVAGNSSREEVASEAKNGAVTDIPGEPPGETANAGSAPSGEGPAPLGESVPGED